MILMLYKYSEEFRASMFKAWGFVAASPFGAVIMQLFTGVSSLDDLNLWFRLLATIPFLCVGIILFNKSYSIMIDRDMKLKEDSYDD